MEGATTSSSSIRLIWRIFDVSMTLGDDPSGAVPDVVDGGRPSRSSQSSRGGEGLDCVFNFLYRVFLVKVKGLIVTTVIDRGLFVSYPAA